MLLSNGPRPVALDLMRIGSHAKAVIAYILAAPYYKGVAANKRHGERSCVRLIR